MTQLGKRDKGPAVTSKSPQTMSSSYEQIQWLLSRSLKNNAADNYTHMQEYGDLSRLNKNGLILNLVGRDVLRDIVHDYLSFLETSAAIYEKNGDYALGIFSSGWCRMLDQASRKLCRTDDNLQALSSGKWLCHESCWTNASKRAIETGEPVDNECAGGLYIYAVPIFAGGNIVGSINFGYGDPPKDDKFLTKIAEDFEVSIEELKKEAVSYRTRPAFIVDMVKKKLHTSAMLIGKIVEQKLTEKKLIEKSSELETLLDTAAMGVVVHGPDTKIIRSNPAARNMLGLNESQITGRDAYSKEWKLVNEHGEQMDIADFPVSKVFSEKKKISNRLIGVCRDISPSPVWCLVDGVPIFDEKGNVKEALMTFMDITEFHETRLELIRNREMSRQLEKMASIGAWELDVKNQSVHWSEETCRIHGVKPGYRVRLDEALTFFEPPDREKLARAVEHLMETGEGYEFELGFRSRKGHKLWVRLKGMAEMNRGKPVRLFGTIQDITEHKSIQIEREKLYRQLEIKNAELQNIVYVTSHDLRSPLINIRGFCRELSQSCKELIELVKKEISDSNDKQKTVELINEIIPEEMKFIEAGAEKLDFLLSGLLHVSRVGSRKIEIKSVDMNNLISSIVRTMNYQIKNHEVKLEVGKLPPCLGDENQINQLFSNLIDNSLKYLDPSRPGKISITGKTVNDHSVYAVIDNGIGIRNDKLDDIFGLFNRLEPGMCTGDGIGLTIVKKILERNHGSVTVESEPGKGTSFIITLPTGS